MVLSYLFPSHLIIMDDLKWNPHLYPLTSFYISLAIFHIFGIRNIPWTSIDFLPFFTPIPWHSIWKHLCIIFSFGLQLQVSWSLCIFMGMKLHCRYTSSCNCFLFYFFKEIIENKSFFLMDLKYFLREKTFDVGAVFQILWYGYIWMINIQFMLQQKNMIEIFVFRFMLSISIDGNLTTGSHKNAKCTCNHIFICNTAFFFSEKQAKQQKLD